MFIVVSNASRELTKVGGKNQLEASCKKKKMVLWQKIMPFIAHVLWNQC